MQTAFNEFSSHKIAEYPDYCYQSQQPCSCMLGGYRYISHRGTYIVDMELRQLQCT